MELKTEASESALAFRPKIEFREEPLEYHLPPLPSPITEPKEATPKFCHSSLPSQLSRMSIGALLNPKGSDESESKPQTLALQYYGRYLPSPYGHHHTQYQEPHYYPEKSLMLHNKQSGLTHRTGSAHSSPGPYRCQRFDSVSSNSTTVSERRRPPRPKYEEEEMYFIWYHRVDLSQEWKEVRESFNRQFPTRQRRGFQGIQCKFYRFIKEKKCPTLREQRRMRDGEFIARNGSKYSETLPRFGVVQWMGVWYPWMRESKAQVLSRHAAARSARL